MFRSHFLCSIIITKRQDQMTSAVFELEHSARALCPRYKSSDVEQEAECHKFLVGTCNYSGQNRIFTLEFNEETNSISHLSTWTHEEAIKHLSCSPSRTTSLFSAVFLNSSSIYQIVDDMEKEILSVSLPCNQILWDPEGSETSCVCVTSNALAVVSLESGQDGSFSYIYDAKDDNIRFGSLDPFHPYNCLLSTNNQLCLIDTRAPGAALQYYHVTHGFGPLAAVDFSPVTPGRFLTAGSDGSVKIHDIRMNIDNSLDTNFYIQAHDHTVQQAMFNPFHDELVLSCSSDQSLRLWELKNKYEKIPIQSLSDFHDTVTSLCWSGSGPWVFAGLSFSGKVVVDSVQNDIKMNILLEGDESVTLLSWKQLSSIPQMADIRAQVDALASEIAAVKKEKGSASEECKALVKKMAELRSQLPKQTKEKKEELSYFDTRLALVKEMGLMGAAYPHKFHRQYTLPELREKFAGKIAEKGSVLPTEVTVAGRVVVKRSSSSKLHFLMIQGDLDKLQIISSLTDYENEEAFRLIHSRVKRGDIIGVVGKPGLSNTGEFSLFASKIQLLSACFHMLPDDFFGLSSVEQRYRQRYLDFIVNPQNIQTFQKRSKIINFVRNFFMQLSFTEVETPTLNSIAGGAAARPFVTFHNDLNQTMYLRIAPELYLKELVVGGMDRVFEIGKQFRNESIDLTHNPEFTSIEAYSAYDDYNDWMSRTEDLLHGLAMELFGSSTVPYTPTDSEGKPLQSTTFNFSKPFKRLRVIPELEKRLQFSFANVNFENDAGVQTLIDLCKKHSVECLPPLTAPRLLDALIAEFLEPERHDPCFICDHPRVMSPLAKWHRDDVRLTERFELFINKKELVNAYTELNNPIVQREEFMKQMTNRDKGDDESMKIDEGFIASLEHALPPTGGWGMGIDRLIMLMTSQANIKEVLLFPAMKDVNEKASVYPPGTAFNGQGVPRLH
eukprot:gene1000-593_t